MDGSAAAAAAAAMADTAEVDAAMAEAVAAEAFVAEEAAEEVTEASGAAYVSLPVASATPTPPVTAAAVDAVRAHRAAVAAGIAQRRKRRMAMASTAAAIADGDAGAAGAASGAEGGAAGTAGFASDAEGGAADAAPNATYISPNPAWRYLKNDGNCIKRTASYKDCAIRILREKSCPRDGYTVKQVVDILVAQRMRADTDRVPPEDVVRNVREVLAWLFAHQYVERTSRRDELKSSDAATINRKGRNPRSRKYRFVKAPPPTGRFGHETWDCPRYTTCVDALFSYVQKTHGRTSVTAEEFAELIISEKLRPCSSSDPGTAAEKKAAQVGVLSALEILVASTVVNQPSCGGYTRTGLVNIDAAVKAAAEAATAAAAARAAASPRAAASRAAPERAYNTANDLAPESMLAATEAAAAAAGAHGKQDAPDDDDDDASGAGDGAGVGNGVLDDDDDDDDDVDTVMTVSTCATRESVKSATAAAAAAAGAAAAMAAATAASAHGKQDASDDDDASGDSDSDSDSGIDHNSGDDSESDGDYTADDDDESSSSDNPNEGVEEDEEECIPTGPIRDNINIDGGASGGSLFSETAAAAAAAALAVNAVRAHDSDDDDGDDALAGRGTKRTRDANAAYISSSSAAASDDDDDDGGGGGDDGGAPDSAELAPKRARTDDGSDGDASASGTAIADPTVPSEPAAGSLEERTRALVATQRDANAASAEATRLFFVHHEVVGAAQRARDTTHRKMNSANGKCSAKKAEMAELTVRLDTLRKEHTAKQAEVTKNDVRLRALRARSTTDAADVEAAVVKGRALHTAHEHAEAEAARIRADATAFMLENWS